MLLLVQWKADDWKSILIFWRGWYILCLPIFSSNQLFRWHICLNIDRSLTNRPTRLRLPFSSSPFLYFVPRMARNESGLVCMDFVHNPWWTCVQTRLSINTKSDIFMWTSIWEYMTTIAGINLFDVAFMRKLDERLIN